MKRRGWGAVPGYKGSELSCPSYEERHTLLTPLQDIHRVLSGVNAVTHSTLLLFYNLRTLHSVEDDIVQYLRVPRLGNAILRKDKLRNTILDGTNVSP